MSNAREQSGAAPPPPPVDVDGAALFLDLDGTLLEFSHAPMAVDVSHELRDLLARLHDALGGACAVVSGRAIEVLDQLLAPLRLPSAGLHGVERRDAAGVLHRDPRPLRSVVAAVRAELESFAAAHPGTLVEDKTFATALHYRAAPEHAAAATTFAAQLERSLAPDLTLMRGHMVIEVKPGGVDKGGAIRAFMAEAPFHGRRCVFAGDDTTDEFGFQVANELGGCSIKVGAGASAARWRLRDPTAVRQWLASAI